MDLDMKTKMSRCMENIFFYRLKFRTINLVSGQNIIDNIII